MAALGSGLACLAFVAGAAVPSSFFDFLVVGFFSTLGSATAASGSLSSLSLMKSAARLRGLTCLAGCPLTFTFEAESFFAADSFCLAFLRIDLGVSLGDSAGLVSTFLVFFAGESAAAAAAAESRQYTQQGIECKVISGVAQYIPLRFLSFLSGAILL